MTRIYQAIITKYLGPTDRKGSRIKATAGTGHHSCTLHYDDALNAEDNHREAAVELAKRLDWPTDMIGGSTKDFYVWVSKEN